MVLGILSGKPDKSDSQVKEKKMFDDKVSGVLGVVASFGGFGGLAFVVASLIPGVAIAAATLIAVAGAHTWLTRKG
jgi:predicted secreted protein